MKKNAKFLIASIVLLALPLSVIAGEMVYFKSYDGEHFACDRANLSYNLDHENGKLAAICTLLAQPGVEDGLTEDSAFKLDVDGRLFRKYILNIFRYGRVAFKNKADAENTLSICEDLGLPLAEEYLCTKVLKIKRRQVRAGLQGMNGERESEFLGTSELDEVLGRFVGIQGGTFQMGSPTEEQDRHMDEIQHSVTLSDFELGEAAITQETYARIMGTNPAKFVSRKFCPGSYKKVEGPGGQQIKVCADHPVERVSWNDAVQFINTLNARVGDFGYEFSLPTEAQLEFAFRGGTKTAFVSGVSAGGLGEYVWNSENSNQQTQPVKSKRANAFGVHQSSVREWTKDWYGRFSAVEETDPQGPAEGLDRVIRGCSWYQAPSTCRSALRSRGDPDSSAYYTGFRLLRFQKSGSQLISAN